MLNRKLTLADLGKEFTCNENGVTSAVKLLYIEDETEGYPYCFTCLSIAQAHYRTYSHIWTDSKGRGAGSEVISEIEEPEEFRLTGKEVWRSSTDKEEKELDDALGLKEISLKINTSVFDALEEKAKQQGIILKALVRQILTDYLA